MGENAAEVIAEIEMDYRERLAAAIRDRDAGWAAAADALFRKAQEICAIQHKYCGDATGLHLAMLKASNELREALAAFAAARAGRTT